MSHKERDEDYKFIVLKIDNKYRVIHTDPGPDTRRQFIVQYRKGSQWHSLRFYPRLPALNHYLLETYGVKVSEDRVWG